MVRAFKPAANDSYNDGGKLSPTKVVKVINDAIAAKFAGMSPADKTALWGKVKPKPSLAVLKTVLQQLGITTGTYGDVADLKRVQFFVYVNETGWRTEFAGGFAASRVVNHKYAVVNNMVMENKSGEDSANLGLDAFVHLSNPEWGGAHWAVSFGLGVNSGSDLSLFFGPSWRLGGLGFVTAGVNFARVDTLPNGQSLGQAPVSTSVLANLGKRTESGVFLSWSYPFLGSAKDALSKPFSPVVAGKPAAAGGT